MSFEPSFCKNCEYRIETRGLQLKADRLLRGIKAIQEWNDDDKSVYLLAPMLKNLLNGFEWDDNKTIENIYNKSIISNKSTVANGK
jgi:hypothetical protein